MKRETSVFPFLPFKAKIQKDLEEIVGGKDLTTFGQKPFAQLTFAQQCMFDTSTTLLSCQSLLDESHWTN
jgi:hypothetical protein